MAHNCSKSDHTAFSTICNCSKRLKWSHGIFMIGNCSKSDHMAFLTIGNCSKSDLTTLSEIQWSIMMYITVQKMITPHFSRWVIVQKVITWRTFFTVGNIFSGIHCWRFFSHTSKTSLGCTTLHYAIHVKRNEPVPPTFLFFMHIESTGYAWLFKKWSYGIFTIHFPNFFNNGM